MRSFPLRAAVLAACLLAATGPGRADDRAGTTDRAADAAIHQSLKEVINRGADLYNPPNSDYAGCWRLYEGALIGVRPFLSHRPALQDEITKGLAAAQNEPSVAARPFILRKVMDEVRTAVKPGGAAAAATAPPPRTAPPEGRPARTTPATPTQTLWERLGGEENVRRVVSDLLETAGPDPKVNFFRDGKYKLDGAGLANLKQHLVEFVSAATGGPLAYTGKDMKTVHQGMGITDAEFDALAGHLKAALERNGAKPADVKAVMTAVGGTRKDIVEAKDESPKPATPRPPTKAETLWERLGGEKNVARVVDDLLATAGTDPKVNFFRDPSFRPTAEEVTTLRGKVIDFISSATGGPRKYTGKDMKSAHKGMKITDAEFDAFAGHLKKALERNGVAPDDVKTVLSAVEGTRKDIVEKPADK